MSVVETFRNYKGSGYILPEVRSLLEECQRRAEEKGFTAIYDHDESEIYVHGFGRRMAIRSVGNFAFTHNLEKGLMATSLGALNATTKSNYRSMTEPKAPSAAVGVLESVDQFLEEDVKRRDQTRQNGRRFFIRAGMATGLSLLARDAGTQERNAEARVPEPHG